MNNCTIDPQALKAFACMNAWKFASIVKSRNEKRHAFRTWERSGWKKVWLKGEPRKLVIEMVTKLYTPFSDEMRKGYW